MLLPVRSFECSTDSIDIIWVILKELICFFFRSVSQSVALVPLPNVTILFFAVDREAFLEMNMKNQCGLTFDCIMEKFVEGLDINRYSAVLTRYADGQRILADVWKRSGLARNSSQIWISNTVESAANSRNYIFLAKNELKTMFNWSFYPSENATVTDQFLDSQKFSKPLKMEAVITEFRKLNKTKAFCWVVSNCGNLWTPRFERAAQIINELSEKTHVWGWGAHCLKRANKFKVENHGEIPFNPVLHSMKYKVPGWYENIKSCKFYFAFENSNCTDYISEKFVESLKAFAVPIVNGWKKSYEKLLPGSYIYPPDFKDAAELGKYLDYLLKNETAYLQYHKWRTNFELIEPRGLCRICKKLSETVRDMNSGSEKTPVSIIDDITKIYRNFQDCESWDRVEN